MKKTRYTFSFLLSMLLHAAIILVVLFVFTFPSHLDLAGEQGKTKIVSSHDIVQAVSVDQQAVQQQITQIRTQQRLTANQQQQQHQALLAQQQQLSQQQQRTEKAMAALRAERRLQQQSTQQLQQERVRLARQQAEQELQRKLALAEQRRQQAAEAKRLAGIVDKYKQLILAKIYPNWLITGQKNLSTDLMINLSPTGTVLNVSVLKSSGVKAFDRSAVAAVYKSSPLPVPNELATQNLFKQFKLTLKPQKNNS